MRSVWFGLIYVLVFGLGILSHPAYGDEEDSALTLRTAGFQKLGDFWICPQEVELRLWLSSLDKLQVQYQQAKTRFDAQIADNKTVGRHLVTANAEYQRVKLVLKKPEPTGSTRKRLEERKKQLKAQRQQLEKLFQDHEELGAYPPVRKTVVELIRIRNEMALAVLTIRRNTGQLARHYQESGNDKTLRAALDDLIGSRFGPARDYRIEEKRLAKLDQITGSRTIPVYREDNRFRTGVLINRRIPTQMSLRRDDGPTLIPASLARSAGIVTDSSARKSIRFGVRKLEVTVGEVAYLQIGGQKFQNIKVFVLPASAEDIGALLGKSVYSGNKVQIDGLNLTLTFAP